MKRNALEFKMLLLNTDNYSLYEILDFLMNKKPQIKQSGNSIIANYLMIFLFYSNTSVFLLKL